jgi:protein-S-isoprenylcysteine O-methyltransferase Ste14
MSLFYILILISFLLAGVTFSALFFVRVPYGRYPQRGWGPLISNRLGWVVMEAPSPLLFALFFGLGSAPKTLTLWIFLLLWEAHYIHRTFIYPFRIADGHKKMPVTVMLMAIIFNTFNASLNGWWLFSGSGGYPLNWLTSARFLIGSSLFVAGYAVNRSSDRRLRRLRSPGELDYKIPYGGLFHWVSCPNYLGEIIEWTGWAIATWSLPGLSFAVWTFANLAPRARAHHAWYREHFADYPTERKSLIPGLW